MGGAGLRSNWSNWNYQLELTLAIYAHSIDQVGVYQLRKVDHNLSRSNFTTYPDGWVGGRVDGWLSLTKG